MSKPEEPKRTLELHEHTGFKRLKNMFQRKPNNGDASLATSEMLEQKLSDIKELRLFVKKHECPVCTVMELEMFAYERGPKGWEAGLYCTACKSSGIFNQTGLHFERGRKETETPKP